ncbi:hypothetical protein [Aquimarina litoralis]|uniref:hypothetical protein n=1 Tax=Aquimarina litoralis TaxID=584605 RepID=UPI001C57685D|nr:hypothetical protein [Aquimarina litoralis]
MNKLNIFLLIILTLISCSQEFKSVNISSELRGKTFNMIAKFEKDTLIIDFKDSTYLMVQHNDKLRPYRVSTFENSNFLILDKGVMGIKKNGTDSYEGLFIGEEDHKVKMIRRKANWTKEMLYGKWIQDEYINQTKETAPPPPPLITNTDFEWPPYYEITEEKIKLNSFKISESDIKINNSGEFILMELLNPIDGQERKWRIKELTDNTMVINRMVRSGQKFEFMDKYSEDIKLIKKR